MPAESLAGFVSMLKGNPVIWYAQRVVVFLVVPLASFAILALFHHLRHRCPHQDPLCQRSRPCINCYRELFDKVKTLAWPPTIPSRFQPTAVTRWLALTKLSMAYSRLDGLAPTSIFPEDANGYRSCDRFWSGSMSRLRFFRFRFRARASLTRFL